jgi:hypothetical protein
MSPDDKGSENSVGRKEDREVCAVLSPISAGTALPVCIDGKAKPTAPARIIHDFF